MDKNRVVVSSALGVTTADKVVERRKQMFTKSLNEGKIPLRGAGIAVPTIDLRPPGDNTMVPFSLARRSHILNVYDKMHPNPIFDGESDDDSENESKGASQVPTIANHIMSFLSTARGASSHVANQVDLHHSRLASKSRRGNGGRGTSILRGPSIDLIPDRLRVTLKWALGVSGSGVATPVYGELVPSNLVDPGGALAATQPVGFDQWMAFYARFIVMKSKLHATFVDDGGGQPMTLCVAMINSTLATGDWARFVSQARAWTCTFAGSGNPGVISTGWNSHAEVFGVSESEFRANEDFAGAAAAAPADNLAYDFVVSDAGAGVGTVTYSINFYIELEVELFDRNTLALS